MRGRAKPGIAIAHGPGMSRRVAMVCLVAWLGLFAPACAHVAGWDAAARRSCSNSQCYRVGPLDPPWQLLRSSGTELAFFNPSSDAIIQSNVTCREDSEAASLSILTEHLLIGYTDRQFRQSETTELDGRAAQHSVVDAKLDGVPLVLSTYVAKRNGCIIDLSYVSRPATHAASEPEFARFVSGFVDEHTL